MVFNSKVNLHSDMHSYTNTDFVRIQTLIIQL